MCERERLFSSFGGSLELFLVLYHAVKFNIEG